MCILLVLKWYYVSNAMFGLKYSIGQIFIAYIHTYIQKVYKIQQPYILLKQNINCMILNMQINLHPKLHKQNILSGKIWSDWHLRAILCEISIKIAYLNNFIQILIENIHIKPPHFKYTRTWLVIARLLDIQIVQSELCLRNVIDLFKLLRAQPVFCSLLGTRTSPLAIDLRGMYGWLQRTYYFTCVVTSKLNLVPIHKHLSYTSIKLTIRH